jgi:hypothetical protein
MSVDRKAIDDMAKIMNALNGKSIAAAEADDLMESGQQPSPALMGDPGIEAMKKILLAMNGAAPVVNESVQPRDAEVEEALITEPTPRGARIGAWEIVVNEGQVKTYDVCSEDGEVVIARGLYLYEAALGLVRRLNEGVAINDKPIRDLMVLEENFARARNDAVSYKARSQNLHAKGETRRALVAEDRFDRAQGEATSAHEEILRLAGIRR